MTLFPADPSLRDALNVAKREIMLGLLCHHIGVIEEFDDAKQTAKITIAYTKTFLQQEDDGSTTEIPVEYPILSGCPVVFLGGGDSTLTFPVAKGDECIVLFNDRDFDNWYQGNLGAEVASPRLHSFADAIAIIGVRSDPKAIEAFDMERAVLKKGAALVGVGKDDKVKIAGNATTPTTLNTELQNLSTQLTTLCTQIQTLITQTAAISVTAVTVGAGVSGPPGNAALITAVSGQIGTTSTAISNIAMAIAGFLE